MASKECLDQNCAWGGTSTCHCSESGCHQTFSGITAFDAHRSGPIGNRVCNTPESVGLRRNQYGYWSTPGDDRVIPDHWEGRKK